MSEIQKDLVLNPNEYAYVLDKTKGLVSCAVGPYKMSLSNSDALVTFDEVSKKFIETSYNQAIKLFITAPENWYITLKNPTKEGKYPIIGTSNNLVDCVIGKKINITGPITFALYPGQMAKAIQGHRLRSNQYLLARVYDSVSASAHDKKDGEEAYTVGEILVIKGTEVSFYIPPTGIEVLEVDDEDNYIRDAVTLERLEYCILKDEDGNKRYLHGPAVVFPEPTELFVEAPRGGYKFKAIELSKISGIYVKVIAEYKENEIEHKVGEELFITGKDQMIYYPRPEHAIIDYDGKVMYHAIAIPAGEGRYVLNRMTGEIKTIKGPAMFLPDPRTEVIVNRKLTANQCNYWFPGNREVYLYNTNLSDNNDKNAMSKSISLANCTVDTLESNSGFNRGSVYTKPRSITFDNKFEGAVTIDIWTGYAVNVVSKSGERKVITGPTTYLMNYDETIEVLELSTGRPKTTDNLLKTVYLRVENNKISDLINLETKDFVKVGVKVSYCLDFLEEHKNKWFAVENYVKYMTDRQRSLLKREAKKHTIEDFYANAADIIRNVVLNISDIKEPTDKPVKFGRFFSENGMLVHDVEVLSIDVDRDVASIIEEHQEEMIRKTLELSDAAKRIETTEKLCAFEKEENELKQMNRLHALNLQRTYEIEKIKKDEEITRISEIEEAAKLKARADLQPVIDMITSAELIRQKSSLDADLAKEEAKRVLKAKEQQTYANTVKEIMTSISPDLIAALTSKSNAAMLETLSSSMSPYAIANGESVSDVTNKLLRGTSLEGLIGEFVKK